MLSIGYDLENNKSSIDLKKNEIELIIGEAGGGKSTILAKTSGKYQSNAIILSFCGTNRDNFKNSYYLKIDSDDCKKQINTALSKLNKQTVYIEFTELLYFTKYEKHLMNKLYVHFKNNKNSSFLGIDGVYPNYDYLLKISNLGVTTKIALQSPKPYENIIVQNPNRIKQTTYNFKNKIK